MLRLKFLHLTETKILLMNTLCKTHKFHFSKKYSNKLNRHEHKSKPRGVDLSHDMEESREISDSRTITQKKKAYQSYQKSFYIKSNLKHLFDDRIKLFIVRNYSILPNLISSSIIKLFSYELKNNQSYLNYIKNWNAKSVNEKVSLIAEENFEFDSIDHAEYEFYKPLIDLFVFFISTNFKKEMESLKFITSLSDMTMPHNWYPQARALNRKIYYHMGPTNSGKTHSALEALRSAKTGIYCAPLRLLAWEIQDKLLSCNIRCSLMTGQEKSEVENASHFSCTIECCPTNMNYDVAVIDEIQLIADPFRGHAWTTAFLGLVAEEIHICGDERALKLIHQLCLLTGDQLVKKSYERRSELVVEKECLHSVSQLRPGDCIIAFNRRTIFSLQNLINKNFNSKSRIKDQCAIIYGNLPPETKKQQAASFNNLQNGISFLLATDAIGMGLNLNINRIIFAQLTKRDSKMVRLLNEYEIKQISGRAGRNERTGYVNAMSKKDLEIIRTNLSKTSSRRKGEEVLHKGEEQVRKRRKIKPRFTYNESMIDRACLFPPLATIVEFSEALKKYNSINSASKKVSLVETLKKFEVIANIGNLYKIRDLTEIYKLSENLEEELSYLTIEEQYHFLSCPIRHCVKTVNALKFYMSQFAKQRQVRLPENYHLDNKIFVKKSYRFSELKTYEEIYNTIEIYVWLSHKYEKEFIERELGCLLKDRASKIIDSVLQNENYDLFSDLRTENVDSQEEEEEDSQNTREKLNFIECESDSYQAE